jgi:ubiquinone/menaquinone biosynthesis C-methylase UbiE
VKKFYIGMIESEGRYQIISNYLQEKYKKANILDVGCAGINFANFANTFPLEYWIIGLDKDLKRLSETRKLLKNTLVDLVHADGKRLPFRDKSVNVVLDIGCSTTLGGEDQEKVIKECRRVVEREFIRFSDEKVGIPIEKSIKENVKMFEEIDLEANEVYADPFKKRLLIFYKVYDKI